MTPNWNSYLCSVNELPMSILVDLSFHATVSMPGYPLLGRVSFCVESPDSRGFPGQREYDGLTDIEDRLLDAFSQNAYAMYVGRSMGAGRFDCFFYLGKDAKHDWPNRVRELAKTAETAVAEDPDWGFYHDFLYPDDHDLLAMQNLDACRALDEKGDDPERFRKIEHISDFSSAEKALDFANALNALGFVHSAPETVENNGSSDAAPAYRVRFSRQDRPAELDETVFSLAELALSCSGVYRGWTAPVTERDSDERNADKRENA